MTHPKRRVSAESSVLQETTELSSIGCLESGLHVVFASPEIAPFAKTGGLGDVLGALPKALEKLGIKVSLIMPAYRAVLHGGFSLEDIGVHFTVPVSRGYEDGTLMKARAGSNIPVYFIRADRYFDRDYLYGTNKGDYPDNAQRFIFFSRAVLEVLKLFRPSILHANDWQSALSVAFLKAQPRLYPELSSVKTVFSIHNLGYQGLLGNSDWHLLNLDSTFFTPRYLEFYGKINFLKGGLVFADKITTVSQSYAEEIKTEGHGFGLEGIFRERADSLTGILNGADYDVWNPQTDSLIAQRYSPKSLIRKRMCKTDLQRIFKLAENHDVPLIGMVARMTAQKGFDLLEDAIENILSRDLQFALLGMGDIKYQDFFRDTLAKYPSQAGVKILFDESLAHRVIAGSDFSLMPSRYEPGGLTQIYSLKYGTIPIVRATGGLKDTIINFDTNTKGGNGIVFSSYDTQSLMTAIDRALAIYYQTGNRETLMKSAMAADFSWGNSARAYLSLYQNLVGP